MRLIDAPGLHDDNAARDGVVRATLRAADGVLLVANIRRAVNDKTTKDALPLALREALGARGRLGDVAVVATQADVLNKSEARVARGPTDPARIDRGSRARGRPVLSPNSLY